MSLHTNGARGKELAGHTHIGCRRSPCPIREGGRENRICKERRARQLGLEDGEEGRPPWTPSTAPYLPAERPGLARSAGTGTPAAWQARATVYTTIPKSRGTLPSLSRLSDAVRAAAAAAEGACPRCCCGGACLAGRRRRGKTCRAVAKEAGMKAARVWRQEGREHALGGRGSPRRQTVGEGRRW